MWVTIGLYKESSYNNQYGGNCSKHMQTIYWSKRPNDGNPRLISLWTPAVQPIRELNHCRKIRRLMPFLLRRLAFKLLGAINLIRLENLSASRTNRFMLGVLLARASLVFTNHYLLFTLADEFGLSHTSPSSSSLWFASTIPMFSLEDCS